MNKKFIIALAFLLILIGIGAFLLVHFVILNENTLPKIEAVGT